MATQILARSLAALALCLSITACGGGGNDSPPAPQPTTCQTTPVVSGRQVGRLMIPTDTYTYPLASGVQDRTFAPIEFTNTSAGAVTVQVSATSTRALTTPPGLQGQTALQFVISVEDETINQTVPSAQDSCPLALEGIGAASSVSVDEKTVFNVSVPAGHTFRFTSLARVSPNVGTVGFTTLTTTALDLSVTEI